MKMALVKTLLDSAVAHIGHKLEGWRYIEGDSSDAVHFHTRDRLDQLWTWGVSPNDRQGHTRWAVVRCELGRERPTRLDVGLPDWSDLGELLKECVSIVTKARKGDPELIAAQARYRQKRLDEAKTDEAEPTPKPTQTSLF